MKVNIELLKVVKERGGRCLCSMAKNCPCNKLLDSGVCECGLYYKENKE